MRLNGQEYGIAAQIAHGLGGDVTEAMVRNWAARDGLTRYRLGRGVRYALGQAAHIEVAKRRTTRGRPRRVDDDALVAA